MYKLCHSISTHGERTILSVKGIETGQSFHAQRFKVLLKELASAIVHPDFLSVQAFSQLENSVLIIHRRIELPLLQFCYRNNGLSAAISSDIITRIALAYDQLKKALGIPND